MEKVVQGFLVRVSKDCLCSSLQLEAQLSHLSLVICSGPSVHAPCLLGRRPERYKRDSRYTVPEHAIHLASFKEDVGVEGLWLLDDAINAVVRKEIEEKRLEIKLLV